MKLILNATIFFASFLFAAICDAQPILNQSNFLVPGFNFQSYEVDIGSLTEGSAGAAQFWDFSSAPLIFPNSFITVSNSSGSPFSADFPLANTRTNRPNGTSSTHSFYFKDSNKLDYLGYGTTSNGNDYVLNFSNPKTVISFPLSYNQSFTDTFAGTATFQTGGLTLNTFQTGTINYFVDGYGELVTTTNYLTNTLRLKVETHTIDSTVIVGFPSSTVSQTNSTSYWWISADYFPVSLAHYGISYDTTTANGNTTIQKIAFDNAANVPVRISDKENSRKKEFVVFPNMVDENTTVYCSKSVPFEIEVIDINGKIISMESILNAGVNQEHKTIDFRNVSSGLYFLKIKSAMGLQVEKIFKR